MFAVAFEEIAPIVDGFRAAAWAGDFQGLGAA
jgi:hypothetical protein